jgi:hypothetical protein
MATKIYVTGPALIYVGTGTSGAYNFLGFSEQEFPIVLSGEWDEVMADLSGPRLPLDIQFMGEQAYMSFTLTKYSQAVLNGIRTRIPNGTIGQIATNQLGSLMISEGLAFKTCIVQPYQSKTAFSDLPPCYEFLASWMSDQHEVPISVRAHRPRVTIRAIPVWNTSNLTYVLYDTPALAGLSLPAAS